MSERDSSEDKDKDTESEDEDVEATKRYWEMRSKKENVRKVSAGKILCFEF